MTPQFRRAGALAFPLAIAALAACSTPATTNTAPFNIAIVGDMPYGKSPTDTRQLEAHPRLLSALNDSPEVALIAHVGDTHSGKQYCTERYNRTIQTLWHAVRKPLVYTPGDNEWMDCHKAKEGGGSYNKATGQIDYIVGSDGQPVDYAKGHPLANLDLVRALFFATPGQTLGAPMAVHSQGLEHHPAHPADKAFVENVWWEQSGVLFVTVNIPGGSNNGTDPWYAAPEMSTEQKDEVAVRTAAILRWLDTAFGRASSAGDVAMVILTQADLWDVDEAPSGLAHVSGYRPYVDKLAEGARTYGLPVLLVVGDSHSYRSDNPLRPGAPCVLEVEPASAAVACSDPRAHALLSARKSPDDAYAVHPMKQPVNNFHRIVVHGETLPMEWLQLRVDPTANAPHGLDAFGPFSWKRVRPAL